VIAALYVERDGVYYGLPDVDPWDEERDARLYDGPWPVVAHPPCARWSLMGLCRGYYDGQDDGCFAAALRAVRRFGGVLEHPAHSLAWKRFGLPRPERQGWTGSLFDDGWTCEVDQRHYGHAANKPTWLYAYGVELPELTWGRAPTGASTGKGGWGGSHARIRSLTPTAFRDVLLDLASDDPTRLATEGRALPYMGRRRLDQGDDLAG
jgi:hypothetical protein